MSDLIHLKCPSCGGSLNSGHNREDNNLVCEHCGNGYLIKQDNTGNLSIELLSSINQVQSGTDKTVAELALNRLARNRESIEEELSNLKKTIRTSGTNIGCFSIINIVLLIWGVKEISGAPHLLLIIAPIFLFLVYAIIKTYSIINTDKENEKRLTDSLNGINLEEKPHYSTLNSD